jgi:two-component system, cell cycle response regulator
MAARILIIEDNRTNLELMSYLLHAAGHTLYTAADGVEGIERARRTNPDLIVCDMKMPGFDGCEVAKRLKGDPVLRAVPLVAVTSYAMVGDREVAIAAGFDGYLTKPIEPKTFVTQLEAFLRLGQCPTAFRGANEAHSSREAAPTSMVQHASILVVGNSPADLALMRCRLEPFGYEVVTACGVAEALAGAHQADPDLILCDLHMLTGVGLTFVREIRTDASLRLIPLVILLSTACGEQERTKALDLGVCRILVRPVEPATLRSEINNCLRERDQGHRGDHPAG